jgi:hypothetical protein
LGAYSAFSAIVLGSMPPMPTPVKKRSHSRLSSELAAMVASENAPMTRHDSTIAAMRPNRSPIQPRIGEPNKIPKRPALNAAPKFAMLVRPHALTSDGPAYATAPMS